MPYCPKCGKQVKEAANFCKECGFNLTVEPVPPAVHTEQEKPARSPYDQPGIIKVKPNLRWGAIVAGGIAGIVLQFVLGFILGLASSDMSAGIFLAWMLVIGIFSYMAGGAIAGAIAGDRGTIHGLLAAMLVWLVGVIINFAMGWY